MYSDLESLRYYEKIVYSMPINWNTAELCMPNELWNAYKTYLILHKKACGK